MDRTGQVAIVTGGSEGIGEGIATDLAKNGVKVILVARNEDKLIAARNRIHITGGNAIYKSADITEPGKVEAIIDQVYNIEGRLDIFVNNAGAWKQQSIDTKREEIDRMRLLTGEAPSRLTHYLISKFSNSKQNLQILNVISQAGLWYMQGNLGYGGGKMQLGMDSLLLLGEMQHHEVSNIQLYSIFPASVATQNAMEAIRTGGLQNPTTLDSVVHTARDLLNDKTPTRHAYVGFQPNKGIIRQYLEINPDTFRLFPQVGDDQVIDTTWTPDELTKE